MDTRTGEVGLLEKMGHVPAKFLKGVKQENLSERVRAQIERDGRTFISRNSKCPCGSGKRFKGCCMVRPESEAKAYNKRECRKGKTHPQHRKPTNEN